MHYDTAASQVANRTLFLHPLPSCFLQRRSRGSSSPFPSLPLCHLLRLFSSSPPPSAPAPCPLQVNEYKRNRPDGHVARSTLFILDASSAAATLHCSARILLSRSALQLCQRVSLVASHLLTHPVLYIFSRCIHAPPPPPPASTSMQPTPAAPSRAADWDTPVGRHPLSKVFSQQLIFQPSSLNKNSAQIV